MLPKGGGEKERGQEKRPRTDMNQQEKKEEWETLKDAGIKKLLRVGGGGGGLCPR